jgi:hypothetical protein
MKTIFKSLAMLLMITLFFGCSKDSPSSPSGCTPIPCLNGGVSRPDCGCNCPQGYTGSNCGIQITPTFINITKIKVVDFPMTDLSGNQWDSFAVGNYVRPDIFPLLYIGSTTLFQGTAVQDAVNTNIYTWTPSIILTPSQFTSQLSLSLYDEDSATNVFMGGFNFNTYNSTGGFPTTITLSNATSPYKFELSVSYVW